jgi:hypothetical protein
VQQKQIEALTAGLQKVNAQIEGRTIWIADVYRDPGKRFVVRADELLTAFLELEIATSGQRDSFLGKGVFRACGRTYDLEFPR